VRQLESILSEEKSALYAKMCLPKRNSARIGEFRVVYQVTNMTLGLLQKNIATSISSQWIFPEYVQGFVGKRSIASNAALHLAKDYILKADVVKFFDSITFKQVAEAFERLGCNNAVAVNFADLCTLNDFLPQGASTSPILSNLVCEEMDVQLNLLGSRSDATYSRYADDITFSGSALPEKEEIEAIFENFGFRMHPCKFFIAKRGKAQFVTGLSVFDKDRPRVPKKMKRSLRQELYYIKKYGLPEHLKKRYDIESVSETRLLKEGARITGWVDFMTSIEPEFGNKVKSQWIEILGGNEQLFHFRKNRKSPPYAIVLERWIPD
jgi:retron-type reverse transcriptase